MKWSEILAATPFPFPADDPDILPEVTSGTNYPKSTVIAGAQLGGTGSGPVSAAQLTLVMAALGNNIHAVHNLAAYVTLGRTRCNMTFQFQVRKEPGPLGTYNVVRKLWVAGSYTDIYDFTFEDVDPNSQVDSLARQAATMQINKGRAPGGDGHIFRIEINQNAGLANPFDLAPHW